MAKFQFVAVPLVALEIGPGYSSRQLEIMSAKTIRRTFEGKKLADVEQAFSAICDEVAAGGESWNAWCDTVRGERAPGGFRQAKDTNRFTRDINPERVTVRKAA
jgi:hypothetical protein